MQCDFSIILLSFKRLDLLKNCLESIGMLENPSKLNFEILICVNGDDQETKDYLDEKGYEYLNLQTCEPVGEARNKLIRKAKGHFLLFIDDDVELPKNYLLHATQELIADEVDVFGGPDQSVVSRNHFQCVLNNLMRSYFCMGPTKYRHVETSEQIVADEKSLILCNLWIRREIFKSYSFPKKYVRNEENLLMAKLKINGHRFKYINHLLVYHHRKKNLTKLVRATFYSGRYRLISILEEPKSLELVFLVPLVALLLMSIIFFLNLKLFVFLTCIYLIFISFKTLLLNSENMGVRTLLTGVAIFIVYNWGYAIGELSALFWRKK